MHENGLEKTLDIVDGVAGGGDAGRLGRDRVWIGLGQHSMGAEKVILLFTI